MRGHQHFCAIHADLLWRRGRLGARDRRRRRQRHHARRWLLRIARWGQRWLCGAPAVVVQDPRAVTIDHAAVLDVRSSLPATLDTNRPVVELHDRELVGGTIEVERGARTELFDGGASAGKKQARNGEDGHHAGEQNGLSHEADANILLERSSTTRDLTAPTSKASRHAVAGAARSRAFSPRAAPQG
jgi:hypothetical protein